MTAEPFETRVHEADFCVVGGGMAGLAAAVSAARYGARVVLMHERPVLGGNASSECRVHVCGADRHNALPYLRETGLLEELRMTNLRYNPQRSFSVWDTVLYDAARAEQNLTLLLNCSCLDASLEGGRLESVTGWSLTEQCLHRVSADVFADCSGDGILAPLTGHPFRKGREAKDEYDEPGAPAAADALTMGMSILFQTRRYGFPQPFDPPSWAYRFDDCDDLPYGSGGHRFWEMGYWWVELGGQQDSIADTEACRDELLRIAYGVWDHIKNRCGEHRVRAGNWALEWMQFLPGKRESRRYVGAHVLTQNDILAGGVFDDVVAYGGWTMDEHPPHGFWGKKQGSDLPSAVHHKTPSPYGIPYRSLYSEQVPNLMFAGRCHSATHMALSSTRVMGTGVSMGQAVGAAAALAARRGCDPADLLADVSCLQQTLLRDDCYLPGIPQQFSELTASASLETSAGDGEPVRDGINRPVDEEMHRWRCDGGDWIAYRFDKPTRVEQATLLLDSALHKDPQLSWHHPAVTHQTELPEELPRRFRLDVRTDGRWQPIYETDDNHRRDVRLPIGQEVEGVRFTLLATWGGEPSNVYAFYVD
ncbi:MAG: FAD-dependent oxidoreductase [Phycisphaerae bacterium]